MSWTVTGIFEADYGCEERPPEEKTKVIVSLKNNAGAKKELLVEDDWLYANKIDEGSVWPNELSTCQPEE